jgi:2-polyprenyl-6-methoxyphenol hydroxylase-like FAD-dependent oxidoreductase
VDRHGRRLATISPSVIMAGARYVSIARSDLAAVVYDALDGQAELKLNDTVVALDDDGARVRVDYASGQTEDVDLVVGADGLHSRVRELAFGRRDAYERFLGLVIAAFEVRGYRPRDEALAFMHAEVGFQAVRISLRDDVTLVLLSVRHDPERHGPVPIEPAAQRALLRDRLADGGWEVPAMLERMDHAETFYFDSVSQIRMPSWTRGRVALVGDAAACPSFLAGQGSALAMVEAYTLGVELARAGDHREAFDRYEARLASFLRAKQDAALHLGSAFAPGNRGQLLVRNAVMKLMEVPRVADLVMGRSFRDAVHLPAVPAA